MKNIYRLILLVATSLSLGAQTYPSKEYVRLGSRVIAIESPPTLTPSSNMTVSNEGATGEITITGSPNSSWSTNSPSWITIGTPGPTTTSSTGTGTRCKPTRVLLALPVPLKCKWNRARQFSTSLSCVAGQEPQSPWVRIPPLLITA